MPEVCIESIRYIIMNCIVCVLIVNRNQVKCRSRWYRNNSVKTDLPVRETWDAELLLLDKISITYFVYL